MAEKRRVDWAEFHELNNLSGGESPIMLVRQMGVSYFDDGSVVGTTYKYEDGEWWAEPDGAEAVN